MLHLRIICPVLRIDAVCDLLGAEPGVTNLIVLPGAAREPAGDVVLCDVVREAGSTVLVGLCELGVDADGRRAEFLALPGVEVRPWSGMRDAIEIAGPLTAAARDLFVRLEPSIESFDPEHKLWDYELVQDGMVVLSIGDYHDLQIDVPS